MSDILTAENIQIAHDVIEAIKGHARFYELEGDRGFEDRDTYGAIAYDLGKLPDVLLGWAAAEEREAAKKAAENAADEEKYVQIAREYVGDFQWAIMDQATRQQTIDNARNLIRLWEQRA